MGGVVRRITNHATNHGGRRPGPVENADLSLQVVPDDRRSTYLTVYALVVEKNQKSARKLQPKAEGETLAMNTHNGPGKSQQLAGTAVSMTALASYVGNRLDRIVVDKTGMRKSYDFTLEWAPDEAPDSSFPSLATALQEQLGLRLESQKIPVGILVIDRLQRPSEN